MLYFDRFSFRRISKVARYVIFDFDGPLCASTHSNNLIHIRQENEAFQSNSQYSIKSMQEYHRTFAHYDLSEEQWYSKILATREFNRQMLGHPITLHTGILDGLARLKQENQDRFAIVSNASEQEYLHKLLTRELLWNNSTESSSLFDKVFGIETHYSKARKIEMVCESWGVSASQVVYITDTLADYHAVSPVLARKNIIGVIYGVHDYQELYNNGQGIPDYNILRDPELLLHYLTI